MLFRAYFKLDSTMLVVNWPIKSCVARCYKQLKVTGYNSHELLMVTYLHL